MTVTDSTVTAVIVQARMASERLPGKVLADIAGTPMLGHVIDRASQIPGVDHLLVATSDHQADDPIAAYCRQHGATVFRGHPTDVLDRYYWAARSCEAQVVVRITGDCPLLDPSLSGQVLQAFLQADPPLDFAANRLPLQRSYPIGLDTEVCSFSALTRAWRDATEPGEREHVMPYLYAEGNNFRWQLLEAEADYSHHRWTVDTEADLSFVRAVYQAMAPQVAFDWKAVLALVEARPELNELNAHVPHRQMQDTDSRFTRAEEKGG